METNIVRFRCTVVACMGLLVVLTTADTRAYDGGGAQVPALWSWTPRQIMAHVGAVRAGADLTPAQWPDGARVAVSLAFEFDAETVWIGEHEQTSPSYMSRGEYGARAGLPRILALLDRHAIPATFFIPAMTMELHADAVRALGERGDVEIGFHSYVHENPMRLTALEERRVYERAMAIFVEHVGHRPAGFRSAAWNLTEATIGIVRDMGFVYESSLSADDRPYVLLADGKDSGLIELPVQQVLDDWSLFANSSPPQSGDTRSAREVLSMWKDEFDVAYAEGSMFILTAHPQVIGQRHRTKMLDELLTYIKSRPGVWFATHEAIARYVKSQAAP